MQKFFVGTSGWNYDHWKGVFYPESLRPAEWLAYYAKHFNSVELNVTFYRLVRKKTFENWYKNTPPEFRFVVKGSRFITHIKRIHAVGEPLDLFLDNAVCLKEKLLAILWQFPPSFSAEGGSLAELPGRRSGTGGQAGIGGQAASGGKNHLKRLERFLKLLARKTKARQAFEFRNRTWFAGEIYDLLKNYNACLCAAHSSRYPFVKVSTADFLYLRFHGEDLYRSDYSDKDLEEWAAFAVKFKKKDVLAFFNNDSQGYAVKNALSFRKILELPAV